MYFKCLWLILTPSVLLLLPKITFFHQPVNKYGCDVSTILYFELDRANEHVPALTENVFVVRKLLRTCFGVIIEVAEDRFCDVIERKSRIYSSKIARIVFGKK